MPVLLCQTVRLLRLWTPTPVNADAQPPKLADADSSSALSHVHALLTQLPDVSQLLTSSTPKDATVFAEPNNNASAVQLQSMQLADALLRLNVNPHKSLTQLPVNADAHQ